MLTREFVLPVQEELLQEEKKMWFCVLIDSPIFTVIHCSWFMVVCLYDLARLTGLIVWACLIIA